MANKKVIRAIIISHDCGTGGAELSLLGLLSILDRQKVMPIVLLPCSGELKPELEQLGVLTRTPPIAHWIAPTGRWKFGTVLRFLSSTPRRVLKLISLIKEYDADVVYTNTSTVIDGAIAARLMGKQHIWHLREDFSGQGHVRSFLPQALTNALIRHLSTLVLVNSVALKRQLVGYDDPDDVQVIYNGIDVAAFDAAENIRETLERQYGICRETFLIGHVGGLSENKDQAMLLRALGALKSRGLKANCILVGSGSERRASELRKQAANCGVADRVFFLGKRDDVPQLMKSIDALAVSSRKEAFGRVIIEAMAAQKPVVATRSGGPSEIVIDGTTGFLVPVGAAEEMAEKLALLGLDRSLGSRLGEAGKRRVDELFRLESYVAEVQDAILAVAQS